MKRPISREAHGFAELAFIPFTALSPELLHYKDNGRASRYARLIGGLMLGSALLARTEWGLIKKIPFKAHLAADAGLSLFTIMTPWIGRFSQNKAATLTFLFIGISGLLIGGLLTDRKEMSNQTDSQRADKPSLAKHSYAYHDEEEEDDLEDTY